MRKIEEELTPIKVFVYGEPVTIPELTTELYFIPTYISKHFRK